MARVRPATSFQRQPTIPIRWRTDFWTGPSYARKCWTSQPPERACVSRDDGRRLREWTEGQHVDADYVSRFPDLETLHTGLDVQHPEDPVAREDRVDELLRSSVFDISGLEFGLVLEVFHGARETTSETRLGPRKPVSSVSAGVGHPVPSKSSTTERSCALEGGSQ
jgi:hypothetical protein